ncbi:MAG TPA: alpha/beta hydrolase [Pseudonocardia sp.]
MTRATRPTGQRRGRAAMLLGLMLVATLSACAVGPSTRPPVAVRGGNSVEGPIPERLPLPPLGPQVPVPDVGDAAAAQFIDCTDDMQQVLPVPVPADRKLRYECTDIPVGTDDADSFGRQRQSSIGLMRVSLTDRPPDSRPPLLVLGDSDSETGTLRAAHLAAQVPLALLQHFSIVGMDRRGEGTSRLDCVPPDVRSTLLDTQVGTAPGGQAQVDSLLNRIRAGIQECNLSEGDALTKYNTSTTAQDIEQARVLLGVRTLSAVGLGDGARALAVWAQSSPGSVGRLVLDSPPDPTLDAVATAKARASAAEATFDAFGRQCEAHPGCPLGPNPRAALTGLAGQLRDHPLAGADGEVLTSAAAMHAVLVGLDEPADWNRLAAAISGARTGDPSGLLRYLDELLGVNGRFDLAMATRCNDTTQRLSPPQVAQLITEWSGHHPLFGALTAQSLLLCTSWPVPIEPARVGPVDAAPPLLVLGTALSPREPLTGYQRAASQLATAKMIDWQGAGQGAYPRTPCVNNAVDGFLQSGTVPQTSVLCPP